MGIPRVYRKSGERAIASYDYIDIADGTGVVVFNGATTKEETTTVYILTKNSMYSDSIETTGTGDSTSFTKRVDIDFDLTSFNSPRTIKGTAIITGTMICETDPGTARNQEGYLIFRIKKNDVEITSAQTRTVPSGTDGVKIIIAVKITIPRTDFKKGETLRLTVEGWIKRTHASGGNGIIGIGHDPKNRNGTQIKPTTDDPTTTTKLEVFIPFVLDL